MSIRMLLAMLLFLASEVDAQVTPLLRVVWDQPEPVAVASTFGYILKIDMQDQQVVTATCEAAAAPNTGSVCGAPLPALVSGTHTLIVTACNGFGCAVGPPLTGGPPNAPSGMKMVITYSFK